MNLYTYCQDDPINFSDPSGNKITTKIKETVHKAYLKYLDTGDFFLENGIIHAEQNCWQQWWGYNNAYDFFFDLACSMKTYKSDFSSDGVKFRIWLWKGDYLNLGAGAECGIYYGGGPRWITGTPYAMPMSLTLLDAKGNQIFSWYPNQANWWITGFNPKYQNEKAKNLIAKGTINFSGKTRDKTIFNEFCKKFKSQKGIWTFDTKKHIAKFTW